MTLKHYTDLIRLKTSFMVGVACALGMWLAVKENNLLSQLELPTLFAKAILGLIIGFSLSGALNCFNDVQDVEIDKALKPERVLAQGLVSKAQASLFSALLVLLGVLCSLLLHPPTLVLVGLLVILGLGYSLYLQNIPLLKNVIVALSLSSSLFVGAWAVLEELPLSSSQVLAVTLLTLTGIILFELHKDIGDVEEDIRHGKVTVPALVGEKSSALLVYSLYWVVMSFFWLYLFIYNWTIISWLLVVIQLFLLVLSGRLVKETTPASIERSRVSVYALFAVTLVFLFFT